MTIVILILLLLSWVFLHLFTKNNLSILGFTPVRKRLIQLIIGFFIYGLICASLQFIDSLLFSHIEWKLNPEITINDIFALLWGY
ncbi:hypothetical protein CIB95_04205 [Lottiidibacillus patelloidae]|uniref:Uncharacterized protein n=1 Tax=Lottiidibacillus patelloidae TaxID=2670334 RepID=A0A263BV06_9BACI|nr:hypothetical protein [Lottiidibacillus patelloidae]OZM57581.1 hypothetical protein CIB95_04205 [Lottiidibacillus patelloidae]